MGACPTTTEAMRKMGCKTSGGRLFCNDRSEAETARHPGDVCSAPTEAERRPWTHGAPATQQPKPCGRWVARRPGDVCSATTEAERRPSEVRGTSCHEPTEPEARP